MNAHIKESAGFSVAASLFMAGAAYNHTRPLSAFEAANKGHTERACVERHILRQSIEHGTPILLPTGDVLETCRQRGAQSLARESASLKNAITSWLGGLGGVLMVVGLAFYNDGRRTQNATAPNPPTA